MVSPKTHAFIKDDFSGVFLQAGVSELTMVFQSVCRFAGGVIPYVPSSLYSQTT